MKENKIYFNLTCKKNTPLIFTEFIGWEIILYQKCQRSNNLLGGSYNSI